MVVFPSQPAGILFYTVYILWLLSEIFGAGFFPGKRFSGSLKRSEDRGSGYLVFAAVFLSIAMAFTFNSFKIGLGPLWLFYPGIFLMLVGILVRQRAILLLGRFYSMRVMVQEGQTIIEKGPYRFIRHPAYSGALLVLSGLGLALHSWAAVLVLLIFFSLAYGYRISVEEKALILAIGEPYAEYMKKTKRLIPFIF
jgi:protein-S-isoprenylcysteine O-methyltransferase Ste14